MKDLKGIPWQPRDGVRHRITREMSQPVALPPPAAAAGPSAQDEQDQEHPALAIDGSKVDEDAAVVQGVAQLEELGVINDEDDIEPEDAAGIPAEGDDYSPSIAPSEAPASPPPLSGAHGSSPPCRGAGWSSGMQSLPDSPMSPSGLGEGGKRKEAETTHSTAGEAEPKQSRQCGVLRHLTNKEVWERIQEWGNSEEASNPTALQRVSNVTDFVDQMLDPEKVTEARKAQLAKLWDRGPFTPVHKKEIPRGAQIFSHKWVDKCSKGTYKSRFTCADIRARYSADQEAEMDVFVPTPTPEAHNLLEVYALKNGYYTRSLDIVAAFLIGQDRGAAEGKHVYMRPPVEWYDLFVAWLNTLTPEEKAFYEHAFKDVYFRLDGNLYGRRTAGSVYRNELEEILCGRVDAKRYSFTRGEKDPCVFRRQKSGIILIHHIDDIRLAGPKAAVNHFVDKEMPKHCEIQAGQLESEGTAVEYLGRTKIRTKDAIITMPDEKHTQAVIAASGITARDRSEVPSKQLNLLETEPLSESEAKQYRSAVGSAIYLSLDRREIQYAVKEAARRMSQPRKCDMQAVRTLAAYLQSHPQVGRVTTCDQDESPEWQIELYSDSDWAGCLETRCSTDCYIAVVCGAIVACGSQTQPGLPATSSPDAELRGVSRATREAIFLKELITRDFGQACGKPRLWTDSSSAMQASKRIGPGSKLRHLEVCEFYVQGALQSKQIALGKVKGTVNCANFLTKHPKSGTEVRQSLPGLGMFEPRTGDDVLTTSRHINVKVSQVKKPQPWKTPVPASLAWISNKNSDIRAGDSAVRHRAEGQGINCTKALIYFSQVRAVAAQSELNEPYVWMCIYLLAALGIIAVVWKTWQCMMWLLVPPEEADDFDVDGPRQLTLQLRLLDPRDGMVLRLRRGATSQAGAVEVAAEPSEAVGPTVEAAAEPIIQETAEPLVEPEGQPSESEAEGSDISFQESRDEEYEEMWNQRAREALAQGMTPEQILQWRRREERAAYTGQYEESSYAGSATEEEESSDERSNPPTERADPPERAAPPEREEPPVPSDPFENMTGNELAAWRRAENRLLGLGSASSDAPSYGEHSGHSD